MSAWVLGLSTPCSIAVLLTTLEGCGRYDVNQQVVRGVSSNFCTACLTNSMRYLFVCQSTAVLQLQLAADEESALQQLFSASNGDGIAGGEELLKC